MGTPGILKCLRINGRRKRVCTGGRNTALGSVFMPRPDFSECPRSCLVCPITALDGNTPESRSSCLWSRFLTRDLPCCIMQAGAEEMSPAEDSYFVNSGIIQTLITTGHCSFIMGRQCNQHWTDSNSFTLTTAL